MAVVWSSERTLIQPARGATSTMQPVPPEVLAEWWAPFEDFLAKERRYSGYTVRNYRQAFEDFYRWLAAITGRSGQPDIRNNNTRVIEMLVALDLSDSGVRFGPMYRGNYREASNISHIQD